MPKVTALTDQQLDQIYLLTDQGKSERETAAIVGVTKTRVHTALKIRAGGMRDEKVAALLSKTTTKAVKRSVMNMLAILEECLTDLDALKTNETDAPLRDKVALVAEKRTLVETVRDTLSLIADIKVWYAVIQEITAILESETPGARDRIYRRLEASTNAYAATILFTADPTDHTDAMPGAY